MKIYQNLFKYVEEQQIGLTSRRLIFSLEGIIRANAETKGITFEQEYEIFKEFKALISHAPIDLQWIEEFAQYEEVK